MRLKIVSDGSLSGTQVVNADTNERVEGVTDITWSISSRKPGEYLFSMATIVIRRMAVEIVGKVTAEIDEAIRD